LQVTINSLARLALNRDCPILRQVAMRNPFQKFLRSRAGATAIEYGLIAALIAVAIISGVTAVGTKMSTAFNTVQTNLK
jgi:pilus assembly protein Flp/PilA